MREKKKIDRRLSAGDGNATYRRRPKPRARWRWYVRLPAPRSPDDTRRRFSSVCALDTYARPSRPRRSRSDGSRAFDACSNETLTVLFCFPPAVGARVFLTLFSRTVCGQKTVLKKKRTIFTTPVSSLATPVHFLSRQPPARVGPAMSPPSVVV